MNADIIFSAKSCISCQNSKVYRHIKYEPGQFEILEERFDHIHMDLVGPLPLSSRNANTLTIVVRLLLLVTIFKTPTNFWE